MRRDLDIKSLLSKEEAKLITDLKKLADRWKMHGKRLWLFSASGSLKVMIDDEVATGFPEMKSNGGVNPDNIITQISGIRNDGGDW